MYSKTSEKAQQIYETMGTLKSALNRVKESWNDTVSSAIEVNNLNMIISTANKYNGEINSHAKAVDQRMERLEELAN